MGRDDNQEDIHMDTSDRLLTDISSTAGTGAAREREPVDQ
jgi:hypothetical protein